MAQGVGNFHVRIVIHKNDAAETDAKMVVNMSIVQTAIIHMVD